MNELDDLRERLRAFAAARDWEQFHTPKNLAMALIVEAGELVEHFQWLTGPESLELPADKRAEIALEMADVLLYLVRLADRLGVDLHEASLRKIAINEAKYPVGKARGSAKKSADL